MTNDLKGLCGAQSTGEEEYNNNIHNDLNSNNYDSANNNNNILHNDLIINDNDSLHNHDDEPNNNNNNFLLSQDYFSLTLLDNSGRYTLYRVYRVLDRSVDNTIDKSNNERIDIKYIGSVKFPNQMTRNKRQYESHIEKPTKQATIYTCRSVIRRQTFKEE